MVLAPGQAGPVLRAGIRKAVNARCEHDPPMRLVQLRTCTRAGKFELKKSTSGQVIGKSEMYSSTAAMESGIASVKTNGPGASVVDLTNGD